YYEEVGISYETSVARSPQQNRVVERRNRTLIDAARTIKLPDLSFFHVFGALCYPTNDSENLGKLQLKADIGIFIGYAPTKKAFCIYNRRTRRIVETIHVDFDELTVMASEQSSSGPALHDMTPRVIRLGLVHTNSSSTSYVPPSRNDWDLLFQPMFDELLNPPPSGVNQVPEDIAPIVEVIPPVNANLTGSPSSIMFEQDAPSTSNSTTPTETQSSVIPQDAGDDNLDIEVAHMGKPKTYKEALTQSSWIEAMQEELHEFKRLKVWELVPRPDKVMVITLKRIYKMSMMGKISFFLGLQISQNPRGIFINQSKYALESLKKYGFESCEPVDTPMVEKSKLDEDKEGKSITLSCAAISSTEAEYIALSGCCAQILWMRSQLSDYGLTFNKIPMYYDNKSAIALCCNNVQHSRSKHIDIRYHFINKQVENGVIEFYFINTEYQLADLFTKALGRDRIKFLTNKLGMRSFTPETLIKLMNDEDETMATTLDQQDDVLSTTIKVVSRHQTTQQYGVILPIELTNDDIRNNKAYKEYYACATGEAAPKPKASTKKKTSGSASSTTPPTPIATPTPTTTVVAAPRLSVAAKGKQPARATIPTEPTDVEGTEAEQLKIVLKQSRQETHISQQRGSDVDEQTKGKEECEGDKTDESDDDDDEEETTKIGEQEVAKSDEGDDEATESDKESEDEETREQEEESFDPIPRTPEDNKDDDNNDEDQGLRIATESAGRTTTGGPPTPDRDWNKSMPAAQGEAQSWISALAKQTDARSSFNELLDTPMN
nr:retrotransposon protein, putative, unclassified [Tanacetum cinerariifolium]